MNYTAIIPAAGIGKRMGLGFNKIRYELNGKSIILSQKLLISVKIEL